MVLGRLSLKDILSVEPHRSYTYITLKQRAAISGPGSENA